MANHKSAIKRIRTNERKHQRNRVYRSRTRTELKKAQDQIVAGNKEEAIAQVREAISMLDKSADKGIIHKNNAARRKSRLMKRLNELLAE
ncbi:MAG: 30S ribosomal protein S20 [Chloroflexi bacterium]|nr:30S ribosomal protein S20 [Chloroflexota bacterium]